jgi:hypothetical protein
MHERAFAWGGHIAAFDSFLGVPKAIKESGL